MNKKNKKERKPDGIWVSDERRITDECKKVYPTMYKMLRITLFITAIIWIITLICPTIFSSYLAGYDAWSDTFETVTLVLSIAMLVVYCIANYFWQEKMKKFRDDDGGKKKKT